MGDLEMWIQSIITVVAAVIASSGFWTFVQSKRDKNSAEREMLRGLGHDRILFLCSNYISRGWITADEYENLYEYLYKPYRELGGNGTAERLMEEVKKLEIRRNDGTPKSDPKRQGQR